MRKRLIIFDADGTLRRCTVAGQPCPNKPGEWGLIPGVKEVLDAVYWGDRASGCYSVAAIASNQAGVALGYMSEHVASEMLSQLYLQAFGRWHPFGTIKMCPHSPEWRCRCRKPNPWMIYSLMANCSVNRDEVLYVGDMDSDRECAENAGVDFMWAKDFFGWDDSG